MWVVEAASVLCADEQDAGRGGTRRRDPPPVCLVASPFLNQVLPRVGKPTERPGSGSGLTPPLAISIHSLEAGGWALHHPLLFRQPHRTMFALVSEGKWCHVLVCFVGLKWCFFVDADIGERDS